MNTRYHPERIVGITGREPDKRRSRRLILVSPRHVTLRNLYSAEVGALTPVPDVSIGCSLQESEV